MATAAHSPVVPAPLTDEFHPSHWSQRLPAGALDHIPGDGGWPIVGNTFRMLADPHGFARRMVATFGKVYKNRAFGGWQVALIGAEANELMLESFQRPDFTEGVQSFVEKREPDFPPVTSERAPA